VSGAGSIGEISRLLICWRQGDLEAVKALFTLVYDELRALARRQVRRVRPGGTLTTTAVVHEAYVKLAGHSHLALHDRSHFFAVACKAMRQILVDRARRDAAAKRSPEGGRVRLDEATVPVQARAEDLLALDEALRRLEEADPRLARLIELRFFAGLSEEETAEVLDVSARTVRRDWHKARAYLHHHLTRTSPD
jgi:RNA polymerase sigma factor (TIGR02999 family)